MPDRDPAQLRPRRTHFSNKVYSLEGGTEDNDLWVTIDADEHGQPVICSTFEINDAQRAAIAEGANVELIVWGAQQPPVMVRVTANPLGKKPDA